MSVFFNNEVTGNSANELGADSPDTSAGKRSQGPAGNDLLSEFMKLAYGDGKLDDNDLEAMKALVDKASDGGGTDNSKNSSEGTSESGSDKELTPQGFMSQLTDIADRSEGFGAGEEKMLDQGKRLMNATPEQQQAFLDKAESMMGDNDINQKDDGEGDKLEAFVDGLLDKSSGSSKGAEGNGGTQEKSFMQKVEDLLAQSQDGNEGPGEKMARDAAKMLKDNPKEDQQAFLDKMDKLLNNTDGDGNNKKDIDQTNDSEGTMLKKMAEAFEELPSDRGESSNKSSNSSSSSGSNSAVSAFLKDITSDGEVSDSDISALRALVKATEPQGAEAETAT
jgi:hypothetical protein